MPNSFVEAFLTLFYIVPTSKAYHQSLQTVPDFVADAIPCFVATIILEILFYMLSDPQALQSQNGNWGRGKVSINDSITSISAGSIQQLSKFFLPSVQMSSYIYVWEKYRLYEMKYDSPVTFVVCFLLVDLGYYWFHRMAHEVNIFWAFHSVHHSSEYYNQSTALRQSVLQEYSSWIFQLPGAFLIPPPIFAVHKQLNTIYQYWIHTEVVPKLGFLEYIINTPSAHRVHHGRNPYCIDKNYAGTLIIWDIIFGTFEKEDEKIMYGVTNPINTFDPAKIQFDSLINVMEKFYRTIGIKNKLKVLFYGPGWHLTSDLETETPRTGLSEEIPIIDLENPPMKFDPAIPAYATAYCLFQTIVIAGLVAQLLGKDNSLNVYFFSIWVYLLTWSNGLMLEGNPNCFKSESVRLAISLLLLWYFKSNMPEVFNQVAFGYLALSSIFLLAIIFQNQGKFKTK